MWLLSLEGLKLPGSAAARSRPTDGFSAMTRVLLTRSSLASASAAGTDRAFRSMSAGARAHRAGGLGERVGHDRIRHAEADAVATSDRRGEDRGDHAPAPVDHRPAGVARA